MLEIDINREGNENKKDSVAKGDSKRLLCLFLDGLAIAPASEVNAVRAARTPNLDRYIKNYPVTLLTNETKDERQRYWSLGTGVSADSKLFPKAKTSLSAIISENSLRQLKLYASEQALSFGLFFNNYKEIPHANEDRICFNSPGIGDSLSVFTKKIVKLIKKQYQSDNYDLIFASLATIHEAATRGDFNETLKSIELIDSLLAKVVTMVLAKNDVLIICSPYGNAERTKDLASDWENRKATNSPVPFIIIGNDYEGKTIGLADPLEGDLSVLAPGGTLADFAPSILHLLNIDQSDDLEGKSLI